MGIEQPSSFYPDRVWKEQGILFPSGVLRWRQISFCFWQIGFLFSITKSPNWKRKPQFKYPLCFCTHCFYLMPASSLHHLYKVLMRSESQCLPVKMMLIRHCFTGGDRKITDRKQLSPKPDSFPYCILPAARMPTKQFLTQLWLQEKGGWKGSAEICFINRFLWNSLGPEVWATTWRQYKPATPSKSIIYHPHRDLLEVGR